MRSAPIFTLYKIVCKIDQKLYKIKHFSKIVMKICLENMYKGQKVRKCAQFLRNFTNSLECAHNHINHIIFKSSNISKTITI